MKSRVAKSEALFTGAKTTKILDRSRHHISTEQHDDATNGRFSDFDVEVDLGVFPRLLQFRLKVLETFWSIINNVEMDMLVLLFK